LISRIVLDIIFVSSLTGTEVFFLKLLLTLNPLLSGIGFKAQPAGYFPSVSNLQSQPAICKRTVSLY